MYVHVILITYIVHLRYFSIIKHENKCGVTTPRLIGIQTQSSDIMLSHPE